MSLSFAKGRYHPQHMQKERWSELYDIVQYLQYNQHPIGHYGLEVKASEDRYDTKMYKKLQNGERQVKEISLDPNSLRLKQDYLDIFEGVRSDVIYTAKYAENRDIGTTYLEITKIRRQDELKAEYKVPIIEDCFMPGKLMDVTVIIRYYLTQKLVSNLFHLNCPSLHSLTKFVSRTKNILVGNGQYVDVLFVIPVTINLQ